MVIRARIAIAELIIPVCLVCLVILPILLSGADISHVQVRKTRLPTMTCCRGYIEEYRARTSVTPIHVITPDVVGVR